MGVCGNVLRTVPIHLVVHGQSVATTVCYTGSCSCWSLWSFGTLRPSVLAKVYSQQCREVCGNYFMMLIQSTSSLQFVDMLLLYILQYFASPPLTSCMEQVCI